MPTIVQQHDCKIVMYHGDHPPPHVHVKLRDGRDSIVDLITFEIRGRVSRRELKLALDWINDHQTDLLQQWQRMNP